MTNFENQQELRFIINTCESKKDSEDIAYESSHQVLEREILNEISQQELYSQDLINRIETLENDIITTHIDSKFKYKELFPQEKENLGLFNEEIKKIHHNTQENQIVLEEKTNNDGRYSKMSEEQAENLYQERMAQLLTKFQNPNISSNKNKVKNGIKSQKFHAQTTPKIILPKKNESNISRNKEIHRKNINEVKKQETNEKKQLKKERFQEKTPSQSSFSIGNHASSKRDHSQSHISKIHELYSKGVEQLNFRHRLMLENEEKKISRAIEECTFTPIVHPKPRYLKTYESLIEKTKKSQQIKVKKSEESNQNRLECELKECTFTPAISYYNPNISKSRSNSFTKFKPNHFTSNSFQKSRSSSSLLRKNPNKTISRASSSSVKGDLSEASSRNSVKSKDKLKFRKANEEFIKNKGNNSRMEVDFDKKKKKTMKSKGNKSIDSGKSVSKIHEEFSKEITETLNIFNKIRCQMSVKASDSNKMNRNYKGKMLKRTESNFSINSKHSSANKTKIIERSSSKKNNEINKKLNTIGKIGRTNRENHVKTTIERKDKTSDRREFRGNSVKFSAKLLEMYKEDLNPQKKTQKSSIFKSKIPNNNILTKKYDSLLMQAEHITQHLNNVLFAK